MQRIHADSRPGAVDPTQPTLRLVDVAQRAIGNELQHGPQTEWAGEIAECRVVVAGAMFVGVVTGHQKELGAEIRARLQDRRQRRDLETGQQRKQLNIEDTHAEFGEASLDGSAPCWIVNQARSQAVRRVYAEPDCGEACGRGSVNLLQRVRIGHHQISERECRHRLQRRSAIQ